MGKEIYICSLQMARKITGLLMFLSALLLAACDQTTSQAFPEGGDRPAQSMSNTISYIDNVEDSYSFEIGLTLVASKNGKITQLGGRLAERCVCKVSLWDFDTKQKLDSVFITIDDIKKFAYAAIDPITVTPGKKYVVSVNTYPKRDYFVFYSPAGYDILPRTFGNITILEKRSNDSDDFSFPERPTLKNFNGWADIVFVAD
jgi:hypothetical protein